MVTTYTELELDALREVSNIGSSTAATALSALVGMPVSVSTPTALAMPIAAAIEHTGPGEMVVTTVVTPVSGDLHALVMLVFAPEAVSVACHLLGVEAQTEVGRSALAELGNILTASYLGGLSTLTGLALETAPPEVVSDMLAAVLASALLMDFDDEQVILLESTLSVAGDECSPTFLFVPTKGGVGEILSRLGVAA